MLERVADGVWLLRGGRPKRMNVYFIRDGSGVAMFDAGIAQMKGQVLAAGHELGGLTKVILSHAHVDHRGVAPSVDVPVLCHASEQADAQADGGLHYQDLSKLAVPARWVYPSLMRLWDGGAVDIADTLDEGAEVAGFEVVGLPGHSPGLIGLWRERDRLALVSDCVYTLDPQTGFKGRPRVAHDAFNLDSGEARRSIKKLAALEPAAAWPGHADPVVGNVREQLERAADAG